VRSTNVSADESVASNPQTAGRIVEAEVTAFSPREDRNLTRQNYEARPRAHLAADLIKGNTPLAYIAPKQEPAGSTMSTRADQDRS
jgi:hypothetical protein